MGFVYYIYIHTSLLLCISSHVLLFLEILTLRRSLWYPQSRITSRVHRVLQFFHLGGDGNQNESEEKEKELMIRGVVEYVLVEDEGDEGDGGGGSNKEVTVEWAAYVKVVETEMGRGDWRFAEYKVYMVSFLSTFLFFSFTFLLSFSSLYYVLSFPSSFLSFFSFFYFQNRSEKIKLVHVMHKLSMYVQIRCWLERRG